MTTATLPRRRADLLWAETGRCQRDHDITDPKNVFVREREDGSKQYACLPCRHIRDRDRRQDQQSANFPVLICRGCGEEFSKPAALEITLRGWLKREYCSPECARVAAAARKLAARDYVGDVEWSLAACEGVVRTAADDVFFEPDGAPFGRPTHDRTDEARQYCKRCPIMAGCLEYALACDIKAGVWGGLDPGERSALKTTRAVERAKAGAS